MWTLNGRMSASCLANQLTCWRGSINASFLSYLLSWKLYLQTPRLLPIQIVTISFFLNLFLFYYFFNWSIVDLQCCVNPCCTAKWLKFYTYIHSFLNILFHYGLSQDIGYNSLCHPVGPCCLSILDVIVWTNQP